MKWKLTAEGRPKDQTLNVIVTFDNGKVTNDFHIGRFDRETDGYFDANGNLIAYHNNFDARLTLQFPTVDSDKND